MPWAAWGALMCLLFGLGHSVASMCGVADVWACEHSPDSCGVTYIMLDSLFGFRNRHIAHNRATRYVVAAPSVLPRIWW